MSYTHVCPDDNSSQSNGWQPYSYYDLGEANSTSMPRRIDPASYVWDERPSHDSPKSRIEIPSYQSQIISDTLSAKHIRRPLPKGEGYVEYILQRMRQERITQLRFDEKSIVYYLSMILLLLTVTVSATFAAALFYLWTTQHIYRNSKRTLRKFRVK